jgi:hypothetical protein
LEVWISFSLYLVFGSLNSLFFIFGIGKSEFSFLYIWYLEVWISFSLYLVFGNLNFLFFIFGIWKSEFPFLYIWEKGQIMIYNALQRKLKFEQHEPTITGHELWCSATVSSSYSTTIYQRPLNAPSCNNVCQCLASSVSPIFLYKKP